MKLSIYSICCFMFSFFFLSNIALAAPVGDIQFHNASNKNISAQVSTFGKFQLAANEHKTVSYNALSQACSANLTKCTAKFYIEDKPAGTATINVITGKLVSMRLLMKVHTSKGPQQVLRSVVLQ